MPNYIPDVWKEYQPKDNFAWITSLFTYRNYKGNNFGYLTLKEIENYLISQNIKLAILDCYINRDEFLVNYYKQIGYVEVIRKEVVYPVHTFKAALMKKHLT